MSIINYTLKNTPQSLNVLASKIYSEELYLEFRVVDEQSIEVGSFIKGPTRIKTDSFIIPFDNDFNSKLLSKILELNEASAIGIGKVFLSDEILFSSIIQVGEDILSLLGWNDQIIFYLLRNRASSLGTAVLDHLFLGKNTKRIPKAEIECQFNYESRENISTKIEQIKHKIESVFTEDVSKIICKHYENSANLCLLRENSVGLKLNILVGITKTREDIIEKRWPIIVRLSNLQSVVCRFQREKIELRERRNKQNGQYKIAMTREQFYDFASRHFNFNIGMDLANKTAIYAEYLGKKVFYLVDQDVVDQLGFEIRNNFSDYDDETFQWLIENYIAEQCQLKAQRTMFHTITVYDYPSDINDLKIKALQWYRSLGYEGRKMSVSHLATYIFKSNGLNHIHG